MIARAIVRDLHDRIDTQSGVLLHACFVSVVCLLSVGAYRSAWVPLLVAVLVALGAKVRKDRALRYLEHPSKVTKPADEREGGR
ncbi:MAG: hypothetical protein JNK05_34825 [Myxococcales bacterium]|nr:hypothetical protein [Myxococcales bacterium]